MKTQRAGSSPPPQDNHTYSEHNACGQTVQEGRDRLQDALKAHDCAPTGRPMQALTYVDAGFAMFPCRPDKTPYTKHGYLDATTDPGQIRAWWQRWPDALIGLPVPDGYVVIDVDGPKGWASLRAGDYTLPATLTAITGRGDRYRHLWYRLPAGVTVSPKVAVLPGVDIRARGSYVIVPPSRSTFGPYTWEGGAFDPDAITKAPSWLLELLERKSDDRKPPVNVEEVLSGVAEGERNNTLYRYLCKRARTLTAPELAALASAANAGFEPPLPADEVAAVVESASRYAQQPSEAAEADDAGGDILTHLGVRRVSELPTAAPPPLLADRLDPEGHTILFGTGGAGKGVLACQWATELVRLGFKPLVVDYEGHDTEWSRRLASLGGEGVTAQVFYVSPCAASWHGPRGAMWEQAQELRKVCEVTGANYLVVDSIIPACGAVDPMKPEAASQYAAALQYIGLPALSLAHVTKEHDLRYPFGSIFWHNLARVTWSLTTEGRDGVHSALLTHRKRNNYASLGSLLVEFTWEDGLPVEVRERRYSVCLSEQIGEVLADGPLTVTEIVQQLNDGLEDGAPRVNPDSVGKALRRGLTARPPEFRREGKGKTIRWSYA
jgi:hypothetical protein